MDKNTVIFKIYVIPESRAYSESGELINDKSFSSFLSEGNGLTLNKEYNVTLNQKIIDIKNIILKESFHDKFNYLDIENITEKVYKDFGKLFFDKGLLPNTIDNYKLSEFTNGDRTFSFIAKPKKIEILKNPSNNNNVKNKGSGTGFLKNIIKEDRKNNKDVGFVLYDDEFPPLK